MKKLFLIAICFISLNLYAQGNLQFNQVVKPMFNFSNSAYYQPSIGAITVPAGKVWKIETVSYLINGGSGWLSAYSSSDQIIIGDHVVYINNNYNAALFPLWLPAGTYTVMGYQAVINTPKRITISAIEFNVVP